MGRHFVQGLVAEHDDGWNGFRKCMASAYVEDGREEHDVEEGGYAEGANIFFDGQEKHTGSHERDGNE